MNKKILNIFGVTFLSLVMCGGTARGATDPVDIDKLCSDVVGYELGPYLECDSMAIVGLFKLKLSSGETSNCTTGICNLIKDHLRKNNLESLRFLCRLRFAFSELGVNIIAGCLDKKINKLKCKIDLFKEIFSFPAPCKRDCFSEAFFAACSDGDISLLSHIKVNYPSRLAKYVVYYGFNCACEKGRLEVLKWFGVNCGYKIDFEAVAEGFNKARLSKQKGCQEWLEQKYPDWTPIDS